MKTQKILIAYFSHADENYGVGYIEKGNTCMIAEMIAQHSGGDLFEIKPITPYSADYNTCITEARAEKAKNARPALTATVKNFEAYDVVFLGYPNWWGDMPMPVYTFLESYHFSGKTVIPFCTHAGSGLSGTVASLAAKLAGARMGEAFAIAGTTAQKNPVSAQKSVFDWLDKLGYTKN